MLRAAAKPSNRIEMKTDGIMYRNAPLPCCSSNDNAGRVSRSSSPRPKAEQNRRGNPTNPSASSARRGDQRPAALQQPKHRQEKSRLRLDGEQRCRNRRTSHRLKFPTEQTAAARPTRLPDWPWSTHSIAAGEKTRMAVSTQPNPKPPGPGRKRGKAESGPQQKGQQIGEIRERRGKEERMRWIGPQAVTNIFACQRLLKLLEALVQIDASNAPPLMRSATVHRLMKSSPNGRPGSMISPSHTRIILEEFDPDQRRACERHREKSRRTSRARTVRSVDSPLSTIATMPAIAMASAIIR